MAVNTRLPPGVCIKKHTMKKIISIFLISFSAMFLFSQEYHFSIDLINVSNDKINVGLQCPKIEKEEIVYNMPRMVPGTYKVYDFGRFISDFKAWSIDGKELEVSLIDQNRWQIHKASQLHRITYSVSDTWDDSNEEKFVFEPAGTSFEKDKYFVLNHHAIVGFFEGMLRLPYQLEIVKPSSFFGASALTDVVRKGELDIWRSKNYFELIDNPLMYSEPDTAHLIVGGADILIAVYSPTQIVNSAFIKAEVSEVLHAQKAYLGGTLPIKNYAFIISLFDGWSKSGSFGALEHSLCSFYFLPESEGDYLGQSVRDISAHEFFHIITPLSIHSKEIHDFDFMNPQMSKHLWLYEGVTEYAASHVQIREGLIDLDEYLEVVRAKVEGAAAYNDTVPFTVMSKGCLDVYEPEYNNVYEKGALIGLCLDLVLLKSSDGRFSLRDLMKKLAESYGPDQPFEDDALFDKIESLSTKEVGNFLRRYVSGNEPLPLEEYLEWVGIFFNTEVIKPVVTFGGIGFGSTDDEKLMIASIEELDAFGEAMGFQENDIIVKWAGKEVTYDNYMLNLLIWMLSTDEGKTLEVDVLRKVKKKKLKKITLSATVQLIDTVEEGMIAPNPEPSTDQMNLRKAWLGNYRED